MQQEGVNGPIVLVGIHSSKMATLRLKVDRDYRKILEREANSLQVGKEQGKYKEETIEKMQEYEHFINNFH